MGLAGRLDFDRCIDTTPRSCRCAGCCTAIRRTDFASRLGL